MAESGRGDRRTFYGLANSEGPSDGVAVNFDFDTELTVEEYDELRNALTPLMRLGLREMFDLVERNYEYLDGLNAYYVRLFGALRERGRIQPRMAARGFMSACINWLNVVRLFLDHEGTSLARTFGKDSVQLQEFKASCSASFDNSVAYRFLYKLRNYTTHCGLPISSVNLELATPEERANGLHQKISFRLKRDDLLQKFDWSAQVQPDLEAMDPTFELLPLIHEAMSYLRDIMRTVTTIDVKEGLRFLETIQAHLGRMTNVGHQPCLMKFIPNELGAYKITPLPLPMDTLNRLGQVDPSGDLLAPFENTGHIRVGLAPTSQADRYRMERGSLVLSAWLHEEGGSPGFFNMINGLIAEDGDIEPVLTGTINIGATLLQLSAMATNTTPEWILASLNEGDDEAQA